MTKSRVSKLAVATLAVVLAAIFTIRLASRSGKDAPAKPASTTDQTAGDRDPTEAAQPDRNPNTATTAAPPRQETPTVPPTKSPADIEPNPSPDVPANPDNPPATATTPPSPSMISNEKAIELARKACEGKVNIPANAETRVIARDGTTTVFFLQKLPPGTLGGDYHAKVDLDSKTGKVTGILGSE